MRFWWPQPGPVGWARMSRRPLRRFLATKSQVVFAFERQGLAVSKYRFTVHSDGSAVYEGEESTPVVGADPAAVSPAQVFRSQVSITPATTGRIFALGQKLNRFNISCSSKAKNIADTGTKSLTYTAPDGSGSCTYNYSENKDVAGTLHETLQAIAETMDEGRRLDYLHRYDRLGLDAAMDLSHRRCPRAARSRWGRLRGRCGPSPLTRR